MNSKKVALWLTVTALISFAVAASIASTSEFKKLNTLLDFSSGNNSVESSSSINQNTSADASGITSIDVSMVSENVNVTLTDGNQVKAHLTGTSAKTIKLTLVEERVGNEIKIYVKRNPEISLSGINFNNLEMEISIPKTYNSDLKIKNVSGAISLPEMQVGKLVLDTVSGDVNSLATGKDVSLKSVSGEATLRNLTGSLDTNTVSGEVSATFSSFNNVRLKHESVSGNVNLFLPADSGFRVDFKSLSGDLTNSLGTSAASSNSSTIDFNAVSGGLNIE